MQSIIDKVIRISFYFFFYFEEGGSLVFGELVEYRRVRLRASHDQVRSPDGTCVFFLYPPSSYQSDRSADESHWSRYIFRLVTNVNQLLHPSLSSCCSLHIFYFPHPTPPQFPLFAAFAQYLSARTEKLFSVRTFPENRKGSLSNGRL